MSIAETEQNTVDSNSIEILEDEDGAVQTDAITKPYARQSTTFTPYRGSKRALQVGKHLYPETRSTLDREPDSYEEAIELGLKPKNLETCLRLGMGEHDKPCPFLSCKGHTFGEDVRDSYRLCGPHSFSGDDPVPEVHLDGEETCAYRSFQVEHTLEEIGTKTWLTRERIRQIEERALLKVRSFADEEDGEIIPEIEAGDASEPADLGQRWLGSIWTSARGERLWLVMKFADNKATLVPLGSSGIPVCVSVETLARNYKLKHDGDSVSAALQIAASMQHGTQRKPTIEATSSVEVRAERSDDVR